MPLETFLLFALADLALKMTPGPDMALTLTRGMTQGFKQAWLSVLGTCSAGLLQIPAVVLGLATIVHRSPLLFAGVKLTGGLYLIYIGAKSLRKCRHVGRIPTTPTDQSDGRKVFWQGFWTNLLNPKVLLFMIAFLPQFADPQRGSITLQLLALAVYSKLSGLITGSMMAYSASRIRRWFDRNLWFGQVQEGILGLVMLLIGCSILISRDIWGVV